MYSRRKVLWASFLGGDAGIYGAARLAMMQTD